MNKMVFSLVFLVFLFSFQSAAGSEWTSLDSETQAVMQSFENDWNSYSEARQARLLLGAQRWIAMDEKRRSDASERYQRWQALSPAKRDELSKRFGEFGELSPEQRQLLRERMKTFKNLPRAQQDKLRDRFRRMSPENKTKALKRLKRRSRAQSSPIGRTNDKQQRRKDVFERGQKRDTVNEERSD